MALEFEVVSNPQFAPNVDSKYAPLAEAISKCRPEEDWVRLPVKDKRAADRVRNRVYVALRQVLGIDNLVTRTGPDEGGQWYVWFTLRKPSDGDDNDEIDFETT